MSLTERAASAAVQRSAERLQREHEAQRLHDIMPALRSLRISIKETGKLVPTKYLKHVVVSSAPALFVFPCGDSWCQGGGHDITSAMLYSLRAMRTHFTGQHSCDGNIGSASCRRVIEYEVFAEYQS
nr:hypothetical protein [uncultured bacterium]